MVQMRRGILVGVILVFTLIIAVTAVITLIPTEERAKAELPTLHVGNEWVYQVADDNVYTFHYEVIAEEIVDNRDCYVFKLSSTPPYRSPLGGILSGENMWVEKETGLTVKAQISGEYMGTPFTKTTTYIHHSGKDIWPIEVGKEVNVTMTAIENSSLSGSWSSTGTVTVKVEKRENITVPAGTFKCFKVVFYDEYDSITRTSWYSDSIKYWVKTIYNETGETHELISYSIQ